MATDTVKAKWVGPFEAELPNETIVRPGDVRDIPVEFAELSGHWEVVDTPAPSPRVVTAVRGEV